MMNSFHGIGPEFHREYLLELARRSRVYSRNCAMEFLVAARERAVGNWADRCLAVLLLENQVLRIPATMSGEFDWLLAKLGLKSDAGMQRLVKDSVLREGYSTTDVHGFVEQILRRMHRLDRLHRLLEAECFEEETRQQVLRVSREAPKLTLARYIFTPDEVVGEILRRLQIGRGAKSLSTRLGQEEPTCEEATLEDVPAFEKEIVEKLCARRNTYWVSRDCSLELNALVEYPLTSAVLVIKLPGSDLEVEVKRAGIRGERLMSVITERGGSYAPTSHRLFGGSLGWLAQREAAAAAIFSRIYRLVHGCDAPCSRTVQINSIVSIPGSEGETHLMDYLSDGNCFGTGFEDTQRAMKTCVEAFPSDTAVGIASYQGHAGLALQFVGQALPTQAILAGSSSYRLDRILLYLSCDGPEAYFHAGLGRAYGKADEKWLAITVLEEILGMVCTCEENYVNYDQYVRSLFELPENRKRADRNFLAVTKQIGECWGTLLAFRGFSDGESFVLRNAGLKSIWRDGDWKIQFLIMDHDDLTVAGSRYKHLWPWRELSGMTFDAIHIFGGKMGDDRIPGEMGVLRQIFRVGPELAAEGDEVLKQAARRAHRQAQREIETNQSLRGLFQENFLRGYRDFDDLEASYPGSSPAQSAAWEEESAKLLRRKGHSQELAEETIRAVSHFREFFAYAGFLYER